MRVRCATSSSNRSKQLWTRLRDIAAYDQDFRIENVQNADHGTLSDIPGRDRVRKRALSSPSAAARKMASVLGGSPCLSKRQLRGCGPVKMGQIVRLDGPGRKASFHTAPVSADAQVPREDRGSCVRDVQRLRTLREESLPSTKTAPPTPVPRVSKTTLRFPRAAPQSTSAISAVRASLSA